MKVLHCVPTLISGGAERQLAYLAAAQSQNGWDVHVAFRADGPMRKRLEDAGVHLHRVRSSFKGDLRELVDLDRLVRTIRPDVVHSWLTAMDISVGLLRRLRSFTWIMSERASRLAYGPRLSSRVRRWVASRTAAVIANSQVGAGYWRWLPTRLPPFVIPNALPVAEIDAAPRKERARRPLVLFVGRFEEQKNVFTLLEALAGLPGVDAVMIGNGSRLNDVKSAAERLEVADRCRFLGHSPEVWSWMKSADVLAAPSLFEGHPNVVLEAMACRCPVVVSDIPEHREFLTEDVALLVPARDANALAAALEATLARSTDVLSRVARAREAAASLTIERMAKRYADAYRAIVARL